MTIHQVVGHTSNGNDEAEGDELLLVETRVRKPSMYKVILLNDDFTTMEFVVEVLERFFRKEHEEAIRVMLEIHKKGSAVGGVYTREVAETKVDQVQRYARRHEHPLKCIYERE